MNMRIVHMKWNKGYVKNAFGMALFLNMLRASKMLKELTLLVKSEFNKASQRDAINCAPAGRRYAF